MNTNTVLIAVPLSGGDVSLIGEAQRLMASSINKIVSSRSRRGGVSLHRNLLVAGVLFKARDVLIAANTMTSVPLSVSGSSDKQQEHTEQLEISDVEDKRKSEVDSSSSPDSISPETFVDSIVTEEDRPTPVCDSDRVNSRVTGKENVPPSSTTTTVAFAEPPMERDSSSDNSKHLITACTRKRRHSTSSQPVTYPTTVKSPKISTSRSSTVLPSSIPLPVTIVTRPIVRTASSKSASSVSLSTCSARGRTCVNPIVYMNRVNVELTSGIGGGLVQPIFVVKVV